MEHTIQIFAKGKIIVKIYCLGIQDILLVACKGRSRITESLSEFMWEDFPEGVWEEAE